MVEQKIVVVIMGENCENTISMCLDSIKEADDIVYCDGGSTDNTLKIVESKLGNLPIELRDEKYKDFDGVKIIHNKYSQEDKQMNGKQRNFYLNYLKENYKDYWCLVLDADEVLEDSGIEKIKQLVLAEPFILSPRIHHFIGDLGHEDFTKENHFVLNRLFKVTEDLNYPEVEHPVLMSSNLTQQGTVDIHIWHLRECLGIFETQKKFENNISKSNMHTEKQLKNWNRDMLLGTYPRKQVHYDSIPTPIKNYFKI